jgi:F0F1-type ATP synthase alpha subunit
LNRGEKLTELLKQKQYVPMVAEEQVCILYAGVRGFLDKMQTSEIGRFEKLFLEHLKSKHSHILETIKTEKALSDKTNGELKQILEEFIPTAGLQMKA